MAQRDNAGMIELMDVCLVWVYLVKHLQRSFGDEKVNKFQSMFKTGRLGKKSVHVQSMMMLKKMKKHEKIMFN